MNNPALAARISRASVRQRGMGKTRFASLAMTCGVAMTSLGAISTTVTATIEWGGLSRWTAIHGFVYAMAAWLVEKRRSRSAAVAAIVVALSSFPMLFSPTVSDCARWFGCAVAGLVSLGGLLAACGAQRFLSDNPGSGGFLVHCPDHGDPDFATAATTCSRTNQVRSSCPSR